MWAAIAAMPFFYSLGMVQHETWLDFIAMADPQLTKGVASKARLGALIKALSQTKRGSGWPAM